MNDMLKKSATQLAAMIRAGETTSRAAVEAHIERIREINPTINAVVKDRFEQARAEADAVDERIKRREVADWPPFLGVPCTIKECFRLTGMPNSSGLLARKNIIADGDATAVSRLRAAGAIPLGVTNVPELCMWMETDNLIYGRTNNPYNPKRIVGGSSGGEGAIIAAGGSPFGLGSDIGGSIRMPAFFNGVFGHKPTGGLVPSTGQHPQAANEALRYLTTGPLARRAEDLWPLLKIMAGPDGQDPSCLAFELGDPGQVEIAGLSVLNVDGMSNRPVTAELLDVQHKVADALAARGAQVRTERIDELNYARDLWASMLSVSGTTPYRVMLGQGKPIHAGIELFKLIFGASEFTLPGVVLALIEDFPKLTPRRTQRLVELGRTLKQKVAEMIGPNGVMLFPSHPVTAPRHRVPLLHPFRYTYTAIFNVLELPVTQVPLGLSREGLPLGVQVVAAHGNDHLTVAVAMALEKEFGGWVPPWEAGRTTVA